MSETVAPASADMTAMIEQTHPAALRLLNDKGLVSLMRDLRAMKASETEQKMQKVLGQAIRRAAAEKQERSAPAPAAEPIPPQKPGKAQRIEAKRLKEAEKAEKKRVKEAEKAERKAAKHAERDRIKAEKQAIKALSKPKAKPKPA